MAHSTNLTPAHETPESPPTQVTKLLNRSTELMGGALAAIARTPRLLQMVALLAAGSVAIPDAEAKPRSEVEESSRVEDVMGSAIERLPTTHYELVRETNRIAYKTAMDCFLQIHAEILAAQAAAGVIPSADLASDDIFKELLLIGSNYVQNGGNAADVGDALARYQDQIFVTYRDMLKERNAVRRETASSNVTGGSESTRFKKAGADADTIQARMRSLVGVHTERFSLPAPQEETSEMGKAEREVRTYLFAASNSGLKAETMIARLEEMDARFKATQSGNDFLSDADRADFGQALFIISTVESFLFQQRLANVSGGETVAVGERAAGSTDAGEVEMGPAFVAERRSKPTPIQEYASMSFMELEWGKHENSWFLNSFLERFGAQLLTTMDREVRAEALLATRGRYHADAKPNYDQDTRAAWMHALALTSASMGSLPDHVIGDQAGYSNVVPMGEYLNGLLRTGSDLHSRGVVERVLQDIPLEISVPPVAFKEGLNPSVRETAVSHLDEGHPCYTAGGAMSGNSLNLICAATDQAVGTEYPGTIADPVLYTRVVSVTGGGIEFVPDNTSFVDLPNVDAVLIKVSRQVTAEEVAAKMDAKR